MILRFLKSNQAYHFVLIPLLLLVLWFRSYIHPSFFPFFEGENDMLLYKPLHHVLAGSAFINVIMAMAFVILLSFVILRLNSVYAFIRIRTFLPSNIFVLIISGLFTLHTMHPVYVGTLFLLLCIDRIFSAYENQKDHSNGFDAGFYIGMGSLFYFNLIYYFPVIWFSILLMRQSPKWRNFALPIVGVGLPWLFGFSYYFFTDSLDELRLTITQNLLTHNNFLRGNINLQIYLGFLTLMTLMGSFFLLGQYDEKKISTRKYFQIFFLIFLISFLILLLVPSVSQEILVIMSVPLTFLISNHLIFMRRKFLGNVFIYLFLGLIIYLQFV